MVLMGKIIFILISLSVTLLANAQGDQSLVARGNELYKKHQFEKAAEQYQKAVDLNTKNAKALYNLGDALYKLKKTGLAEKAFSDAANISKDETATSRALYNKGVALSSQQKNNSKLNQQQVEQMLNALRKDEKNRQQDIQKKNNIGRPNSKDW